MITKETAHEMPTVREGDVITVKPSPQTRLQNSVVVKLSVNGVKACIWWTLMKKTMKVIRNSYLLHKNYQIQLLKTK